VLDRASRLVPLGAIGELYVGGDGLARGYVNRPDLTADRFVPDSFGAPGERLYRTGDLVRLLSDGRIDYIGRLDHQVKIRGFRIEPGEIEAALQAHAAVDQAVVVVRDDPPVGKRLIGYVLPAGGQAVTAAELRAFLRSGLPDYMVPAALVLLDRLPLNANGKLERAALPAPEAVAEPAAATPPRTSTEQRIAAVWCDLLNRPALGVDQDFFELGGHSLLATQVVSRLRADFDVDLPLICLFEAPTIAALAAFIDAALADAAAPAPLPALKRQVRQGRRAVATPSLIRSE
jgi:acyl carrier protein